MDLCRSIVTVVRVLRCQWQLSELVGGITERVTRTIRNRLTEQPVIRG